MLDGISNRQLLHPVVPPFYGRSSDSRIILLPGLPIPKYIGTVAHFPGFIPAYSAGQTRRLLTGFPFKPGKAPQKSLI